ncbi:HET-domain-containing protein [Stipitochalara longipes BDJ]|nr:HET-domain-containing protein [Stipitochalara longipes BDJ]
MSRPRVMPCYRSLHKDVREIRLMTIEDWENGSSHIACQLHHFELAHAPEYEALSYCWGDASITQEILVDGDPFLATTNLYAALKQIAERAKSKFLWIDAICINQSSIEEKNYQVPLMNALYSQAQRVLV